MMRSPHDGRCLVLAAGAGRRMGGPKVLMTVRGEPWWRTQLRRLADARLDSFWVVNPDVSRAWHEAPDAPSHATTEPSAEPPPMFASLVRGLASLGSLPRVLLVLPVDVPCPAERTMQRLIDAAGSGVAVPTHEGKSGHPLALSRAWIESRLMPLDTHDPREARLDRLTRDAARMLEVDDPCVLANLNTPSDLEAWLES